MFGRDKISLLAAEFLSTACLSLVVLSMVGRTNFPFFLALASGITVALTAYLFGAHSNPVITLGQWTLRRLPTTNTVVMVAAQMLGGFAAWQLSEYLVNADLTNIAGSEFDWRVLIAEALGAAVLGLGIAAAIGRGYDTARQAAATGAAWAVGVMVASLASNSLLNPAVAVGVQSWSWAYALGPILGGVIGMTAYGLLFVERPLAVKAAAVKQSPTRKTPAKKKPVRKSRS